MTHAILIKICAASFLCCGLISNVLAQTPQYTPEQALSLLDRQIRTTLGFHEPGAGSSDQPTWLSLSYVGLEVPKDDEQLIDLISVQCPPATNSLTSYSTPQRLDQIYEMILTNASLSRPTTTISGLEAAQAKIRNPMTKMVTPEFVAYREYQQKYLDAAGLFDEAKARNAPATELQRLNNKLTIVLQDWINFGYKQDIDAALNLALAADANGSLVNAEWRRELLRFYRNIAGGAAPTTNANSLAIPRSTLHPSPDKWEGDAGWTKVTYSKIDTFNNTEDTYQKQTRYGSAGGGFLFWRVGGSASSSEEHETHREITKASRIGYNFEIRRAIINRPWLDQRFFFEPGFWTWNRPSNVPAESPVPLVSKGSDANMPIENPGSKYIDTPISVPMIPSEVIVARKLSVTATVSNSDFQKIKDIKESGADVSGRAFFFFKISGGGTNVSTLSNVTTQGGETTFTLSFEGPVVIGFISNVVPKLPAPKNDGRPWPGEAWGAGN